MATIALGYTQVPGAVEELEVEPGYTQVEEKSGAPAAAFRNILMVSHQGRMQCLLASLGLIDKAKIRKFKNCAIVSLKFEKQDSTISIRCEMVYEGQTDPGEDKSYTYYGTKKQREYSPEGFLWGKYKRWEKRLKDDELFEQVQIDSINSNTLLTNFNLLPKDIEIPTTIYLMRHGQASHNIERDMLKSYTDAELTEEGIDQANTAAQNFVKPTSTFKNFDTIFVSDLKRTSQTAGVFVNKFNTLEHTQLNSDAPSPPTQIDAVILPCSHEITLPKGTFVGLRECDNEYRLVDSPNELSRKCFDVNNGDCNTLNVKGPVKNDGIRIKRDWTLYDTFYANNRRGSLTRGNRVYCENTNMISMAFFFMNNNNNNKNKDIEIDIGTMKTYIEERRDKSKSNFFGRARVFSRSNRGTYLDAAIPEQSLAPLSQGGRKTRKHLNKKHKQTYNRRQTNPRKTRNLRKNRV